MTIQRRVAIARIWMRYNPLTVDLIRNALAWCALLCYACSR